jgi:hypothetical protein
MRRLMLLAASILVVASMAVSPALAHDRNDGDWDHDGWSEEFGVWVLVPVFVGFDADFDGIDDNSDCDFVWCDGDFDEDDGDDHDFDFDNCEVEWSDVFEEWEIEC